MWTMGIALVCLGLGFVLPGLMKARSRSRASTLADVVVKYDGRIERNALRFSCELGDGRTMMMRIDRVLVYQMSLDFLMAAAELSKEQPDARELHQ